MAGETIAHRGAPVRIAISTTGPSANLDNFKTIANMIGNNLESQGNAGSAPDGYPYFITVELPDIDCPNCMLQLIQIMTDKNPVGTLSDPEGWVSYYSCSKIAITGKGDAAEWQAEAPDLPSWQTGDYGTINATYEDGFPVSQPGAPGNDPIFGTEFHQCEVCGESANAESQKKFDKPVSCAAPGGLSTPVKIALISVGALAVVGGGIAISKKNGTEDAPVPDFAQKSASSGYNSRGGSSSGGNRSRGGRSRSSNNGSRGGRSRGNSRGGRSGSRGPGRR